MRLPILLLMTAPLFAQSFDVASVKAIKAADLKEPAPETITVEPGSLSMRNINLRACLRWAYDLKDYQIAGPSWMATEMYEIGAKAAGPAPAAELRKMLQALLTERFKMASHFETKDLAVYALTVGKGGLKVKESAGPAAPMKVADGTVILTGYTFGELADRVSTRLFGLDRPVFDKTETKGTFDFSIKLADSNQEMKMNIERMQRDPDPSGVASALQAMGIKLEAQKGPAQMLVVDRAEKIPTEN